MKKLNLLILTLLLGSTAYAQMPKLNLPDDPSLAGEARRRFAISVDEMGVKRYDFAAQAVQWLEKNTPLLYDGLYIHGYKAYEGLASSADEDGLKKSYLDSMMYFYNMKEVRFKLTDREKNNRAFRYYKYWKSDKTKIGEGMKAYAKAYENPNAVINNNIVSYMDMVRRYRAYGNEFSDEDVFDVYSTVMSAIDIKEENGGDLVKLDKYRGTVNGLLTQIIGDGFNCEFIDEKLAPALNQKEDLKLAKKVFGLLLNQGCSDSPYYLKSAIIINKNEPSAGLTKAIAQKFYRDGDLENAATYYQEALSLETDDEKKADLYLNLAKLKLSAGDKAEARNYAKEASKLDGEVKSEAFTFIGDMYMNSFDDCKKSQSQIDDRAIFMAAYDMYQQAGNSEGMGRASAQFPTVSDVFTANKNQGDEISVGCWIGVKTKIRTRPSE